VFLHFDHRRPIRASLRLASPLVDVDEDDPGKALTGRASGCRNGSVSSRGGVVGAFTAPSAGGGCSLGGRGPPGGGGGGPSACGGWPCAACLLTGLRKSRLSRNAASGSSGCGGGWPCAACLLTGLRKSRLSRNAASGSSGCGGGWPCAAGLSSSTGLLRNLRPSYNAAATEPRFPGCSGSGGGCSDRSCSEGGCSVSEGGCSDRSHCSDRGGSEGGC